MLTRYRKMFKKIAMGLLSFMPNEKDLQKLLQTIQQYETEKECQLFLWKEGERIIGLIGFSLEGNHLIKIKHISVNPSHRGQGIGKKMVTALKALYPDIPCIPDENTAAFYDKCHVNESLLI
jgi:riboflavin biosynthesis RibT protein